jgi:hypothetical protein
MSAGCWCCQALIDLEHYFIALYIYPFVSLHADDYESRSWCDECVMQDVSVNRTPDFDQV